MAVIALIDGEHHPAAVRDALARGSSGWPAWCSAAGEEKLAPGRLLPSTRPLDADPEAALRRLAPAGGAVVDLADEPVLPPRASWSWPRSPLHLGLRYEAPGLRLEPPRYAAVPSTGPKLAVIGTGKRTGKTAVAGHWAGLLRDAGVDPVIVCMGRGGPAEPSGGRRRHRRWRSCSSSRPPARTPPPTTSRTPSLAGVRTVGCRRVGGGPAGRAVRVERGRGAALAAALPEVGALIFEGSGACIPPVEVDRDRVRDRPGRAGAAAPTTRCCAPSCCSRRGGRRRAARRRCASRLRPEPAEPLPEGARVALFTTGARALRRGGARSSRRRTSPGARRWRRTWTARSRSAATST